MTHRHDYAPGGLCCVPMGPQGYLNKMRDLYKEVSRKRVEHETSCTAKGPLDWNTCEVCILHEILSRFADEFGLQAGERWDRFRWDLRQ